MNHSYDDIMMLPHHVSETRPHMSQYDRAAQFSPFAALTGYENAIKEMARLTDIRMELDENEKCILDEKMQCLMAHFDEYPIVEILYFQPDEKKKGGTYRTITGVVKKIKKYEQMIVMEDDLHIPIKEIAGLQGKLFQDLEEF